MKPLLLKSKKAVKSKISLKFALISLMTQTLAFALCSCQTEASSNLKKMEKLKEGMSKQEVLKIMGEPLVHEKYNSENIWFYYTDRIWMDGNRTSDECSPLVFEDDRLIGWGKDFYKKYKQKDW